MKLKERSKEGIAIIDVSGNVQGGPDADKFHNELVRLKSEGKTDVILNLKKVGWINSTGVGILIGGLTTLAKEGGRLSIAEMNERIDNLFHTLRLRQILDVYESEDEAVASYSG